MGLDNYPRRYPCKAKGTAVLDGEGRIDCDATQGAGGCPWQRANLGDGAVYGLFGVPCWYRGKVGTWMINAVIEAGGSLPEEVSGGFYGDGEDELSPDYCNTLAGWLEDHGELFLSTLPESERAGAAIEYRYAARWLRWTAEHGDGAHAWW
ncbi:hypothetical protein E1264_38055 [Actinomadura sp. KC216]|uniref:hypothetical protein n=1 Tax=Actinomadura sp. KC216 TaxID=2530370 RepID=UPI00104E769F|nr:hypothetical protein [Actinomadura sp. KC216]TDB76794.1 hypothetical protein E1264_38055 [Actinomadura sp. KC216]